MAFEFFTKKDIDTLKEMTKCNDHTSSRIVVADRLGETKKKARLEEIQFQHLREGSLDYCLMLERNDITNEMKVGAKELLDKDEYTAVFSSL